MQIALGFVSFLTSYIRGAVELRGFDKIKLEVPKNRLFPINESGPLATVPVELGFIQHRMLTEEAVRNYACKFNTGTVEDGLKVLGSNEEEDRNSFWGYLFHSSPLEACRDNPEFLLEGNRIDAALVDKRLLDKYKNFLRYLASDFVDVYYVDQENYDETTRDLVGQMYEYQERGDDTFYEGVWWKAIPKALPGIADSYVTSSFSHPQNLG